MTQPQNDREKLKNEFSQWLESPDFGSPYSKRTIRTYLLSIDKLFSFLDENDAIPLNDINPSWINALIRDWRTKSLSSSTINTYISGLDVFFEFLEINETIERNPVFYAKKALKDKKNRGGRKEKRIPPVLFRLEQEHLISVIFARNHPNRTRDLAMIGFVLDSGIRTEEMCSLNFAQAKNTLSNGSIRVIGKGNKERIIKPMSEYRNFLQDYVDELTQLNYSEDHLLFSTRNDSKMTQQNFHKIVNRYLDQCKIKKPQMGGHLLRHTAASTMLAAGVNIRKVQEYLGHSSIVTTENYLHLID